MSKIKYIAEGFHEDAGKLLNEFMERNSTEFSEFADIWRRNHFSLIFMGRPDHTEISEFTNEMYRLTSQFLSSPSFYQQIGAIYLLYALYRNQISVPKIKIRIEIIQWRVIKNLLLEARLKKFKSLQYVIEYLIENCFVFVAHQMLKGPLIGSMQKISKNTELVSNLKTRYKSEIMQYGISNNLMSLRDLHAQYLEEKKNVSDLVKVHLNASSEVYENLISELHTIVHPKKPTKEAESLGSRRAKIKAQSFIRKARDRFNINLDNDESESEPEISYDVAAVKKKRPPRLKKRVPKHERKVGRPPKKPKVEPPPQPKSDDEVDISHLLPQQQNLYLPPVDSEFKKSRTRRDPYYKTSPKREEDYSSDPDIPT